ncbi:TerB family tellurite resistance protein [Yoonia sp. SDW83-1]|uniref:TerB family tellurite resistance protein n=1 Tax=Yoonia sp. SDW83-1 TaxID=3366945 RepID=UPI00398C286A
MKKLLAAVLFLMGSITPAHALSLDDWKNFRFSDFMVKDLEFVAPTRIPSRSEGMMSLCYRTLGFHIFDFPLTSDVQGYVLVDEGCEGSELREFSTDQMVTAQSLNLIDPEISPEARNSFERNLQTYGVLIGMALAMVAIIIRRVKSLLALDPNGPLRKRAAKKILLALCHAAKCDGLVSSGEIKMIARTMKRLTKHSYSPTEIMRLSDRVHLNLSTQDYINFGKGLRDSEKDIMLRGVLYITMAGGRMLPSEYKFASELAHGLGMPGEDFRRVLYLAFKDMDAHPV